MISHARGVLSAAQVAAAKNGSIVRTAGVVLIRQRPGKGNAIFITLEDEGGVVNILLWARHFERYRRAVMASRLMLAEGEVQRSKEGVIHLMTTRIVDRTAMLDTLGDGREIRPRPLPRRRSRASAAAARLCGEARPPARRPHPAQVARFSLMVVCFPADARSGTGPLTRPTSRQGYPMGGRVGERAGAALFG